MQPNDYLKIGSLQVAVKIPFVIKNQKQVLLIFEMNLLSQYSSRFVQQELKVFLDCVEIMCSLLNL